MILSKVKNLFERAFASGNAVTCVCCQETARRFFPAGVTTHRPFARCCFCGSLERHRLVALMLEKRSIIKNATILSVAPEAPLTAYFRAAGAGRVTTTDLIRTDVDVQADVCNLPFADAAYNIVVANHVLEHVADDAAAMRELLRVIRPGGQAILQTPISWSSNTTEENIHADKAERLRRFGQEDHVRLYGKDIVDRFKKAGWDIEVLPVAKQFSVAEIKKYGLEADEQFLYLTRPANTA